jgi:hypothetical protein
MSVAPHFRDPEIGAALANCKEYCAIARNLLFDGDQRRTNVSNSATVDLLINLANVEAIRSQALTIENCRMNGNVVINKG